MPSLCAYTFFSFAILTMVTLVVTADEDGYYPPYIGHVLDLFVKRDPYDDDVPGSGFTLFINDSWNTFCELLLRMFWSAVFLACLPIIALYSYMIYDYNKQHHLTEAIEWMGRKDGTPPPWPVRETTPKPTMDNRYMTLGGDGTVIFVCGPGGGFEDVIDGDIEGAIARRRHRLTRKWFS